MEPGVKYLLFWYRRVPIFVSLNGFKWLTPSAHRPKTGPSKRG